MAGRALMMDGVAIARGGRALRARETGGAPCCCGGGGAGCACLPSSTSGCAPGIGLLAGKLVISNFATVLNTINFTDCCCGPVEGRSGTAEEHSSFRLVRWGTSCVTSEYHITATGEAGWWTVERRRISRAFPSCAVEYDITDSWGQSMGGSGGCPQCCHNSYPVSWGVFGGTSSAIIVDECAGTLDLSDYNEWILTGPEVWEEYHTKTARARWSQNDAQCRNAACGACCVPVPGVGHECRAHLTQSQCKSLGGQWFWQGSRCLDVPCGEPGKCCLSGGTCLHINHVLCATVSGVFTPGQTCANGCPVVIAPEPPGACCIHGICSIRNRGQCGLMGGAFQGPGTLCTPNPCPQIPRACCLGPNNCQVMTEQECLIAGGNPQIFLNCAPQLCEAGACCFGCSACQDGSNQTTCALEGGRWAGAGTTCATIDCAVGTCCVAQNCTTIPCEQCAASGGVWLPNQNCNTGNPCSGIIIKGTGETDMGRGPRGGAIRIATGAETMTFGHGGAGGGGGCAGCGGETGVRVF